MSVIRKVLTIVLACDVGTLFFEQMNKSSAFKSKNPLQKIFKRYESYIFQAFWEVAMLYSNLNHEQYTSFCEQIGKDHVQMYPGWKSFLDQIPENVHPIIVSSSIREVWLAMQQSMSREHSGIGRMSIIAGSNLSLHQYLIDNNSKAVVAKTLRKLHGGCRVIAFGDSGKRTHNCLVSCLQSSICIFYADMLFTYK